ncbi:MAG TPA: hypothetical protein PLI09_12525 [Candidatus Hydrogenedentes bacterium]|nr:hypothetical protein [Candidatus Hydrogenedentota bacterium]
MNHEDDLKHIMASLTHWSIYKAIYHLLGRDYDQCQEFKEDIRQDIEDYDKLRKKVEAEVRKMKSPENFIQKLLPSYLQGKQKVQEKGLFKPADTKISGDVADHIYWATKELVLMSYTAPSHLILATDGVYHAAIKAFLRTESDLFTEIDLANLDDVFRNVCQTLIMKIKDDTLGRPKLYASFEQIYQLAQEDLDIGKLARLMVVDVPYVKPWDFASWAARNAEEGKLPIEPEQIPDDLCKLTRRKEPRYTFWAKRDTWTLEEGTGLILDREPTNIPTLRELERPLFDFLNSSDPKDLRPIAGNTSPRYRPEDVLKYCLGKAILVPDKLRQTLEKRIGKPISRPAVKGRRGRPAQYDPSIDKEIYEMWRKSDYYPKDLQGFWSSEEFEDSAYSSHFPTLPDLRKAIDRAKKNRMQKK